MTVALGSEMDNLLLATRTSLDHHLLALARRPRGRVALHLTLLCHHVLFAWMTIQLLPSDQTAIPLYTLLILYDACPSMVSEPGA